LRIFWPVRVELDVWSWTCGVDCIHNPCARVNTLFDLIVYISSYRRRYMTYDI
jgi:hypothetical protein